MGSTRQTFSQDRHAGHLPATDPSDYNLTQTLFGLLELESSKQKIFGQSEIRQTATIIRNENTESDGKLEKYFFVTLLDHLFDRSYFSVVCLSVKLFFFHVLKSP